MNEAIDKRSASARGGCQNFLQTLASALHLSRQATMSSLISCVSWFVSSLIYIQRKTNERTRVKRGVATQHPGKYNLDEKELERVSALARIELEDARLELEKAQEEAMRHEKERDEEGDEVEVLEGSDDGDEDAWVE